MNNEVILYVEPDSDLNELIQYYLKKAGYRTVGVASGEEAILQAKSHIFDFIILERSLPGITGDELLQRFRSNPITADVPIVMLTAMVEEADELVGLALGANDYIKKPFSVRSLLARIKAIKRYRNGVATDRAPASSMILNPLFVNRQFRRRDNYCFVLMPFSETWSSRLWSHVKKVAQERGFECERADDLYGNDILEDIWTAINEANAIVADVTGRNPNVMYEIGISHALGKDVVLLTQSAADIPFDFRRYRHLVYADNVDGFAVIQSLLPNYLESRKRAQSAVRGASPAQNTMATGEPFVNANAKSSKKRRARRTST